MSFLGLSGGLTLTKLVISDKANKAKKFEAQFNPTSYKHSYRNTYQKRQGINTTGTQLKYLLTAPEVLSLTLVLQEELKEKTVFGDKPPGPSVDLRVKAFLDLAYNIDGAEHRPRELMLQWGALRFDGALESADVKYTAFDNKGIPLRAEIDVTFRGHIADPMGTQTNSSPDLTHAHSIKDWQTLPMVTEEIYGDPHLYVLVAEANGLDHFRAIAPGHKLHFPPTEKGESAS